MASKNPFMSAWLSEYHKVANATKGQWAAEASRQQKAMMDQWMDMYMAFWFPWLPRPKRK